MKRIALIVSTAAIAVVGSHRSARAQAVGSPEAPDQTIVEGAGVKVGEGTVLHPVVGVETGFTTNVFYTQTDTAAAPFLRALVELNFASLSEQRLDMAPADDNDGGESAPPSVGDLSWHAGVRLVGQEYLSSNDNIGAQHSLAGGLNLHGLVFPKQTWQFQFDDDYIRDTRPTNFESTGNLNRDINLLGLAINYAPPGRALSGSLRYQNRIDVFEASQQAFANRIQHTIGARANWQWLPITKLYADVSLGFFEPLGNDSKKVPSTPLRAIVGIQSALTVDTSIHLRAGYGEAFYGTGTEAGQPIFGAQFGWRFNPNGLFSLAYSYDFTDSIQANYFRDHMFGASVSQGIDKLTLTGSVDVRFRDYESVGINLPGYMGPPQRSDLLASLGFSPRYYFRDWMAATLDYDLIVDSTDYRYSFGSDPALQNVDPSYVRHQLMAGVRAAW